MKYILVILLISFLSHSSLSEGDEKSKAAWYPPLNKANNLKVENFEEVSKEDSKYGVEYRNAINYKPATNDLPGKGKPSYFGNGNEYITQPAFTPNVQQYHSVKPYLEQSNYAVPQLTTQYYPVQEQSYHIPSVSVNPSYQMLPYQTVNPHTQVVPSVLPVSYSLGINGHEVMTSTLAGLYSTLGLNGQYDPKLTSGYLPASGNSHGSSYYTGGYGTAGPSSYGYKFGYEEPKVAYNLYSGGHIPMQGYNQHYYWYYPTKANSQVYSNPSGVGHVQYPVGMAANNPYVNYVH